MSMVKNKIKDDDNNKLEVQIKETNQVAQNAIQKELNLEQMIEREEAEREKNHQKEMVNLIVAEEKKNVKIEILMFSNA